MKTSNTGIEFLKKWEGCALTAYWDYKGYSIGYGHLGASKGQKITPKQAEKLLLQDLPAYEKKVMQYDGVYHWNQSEFDALVSFCYNIGSIKKLVNNGEASRQDIVNRWLDFCHAGGKVLPALQHRRRAELKMFLKEGNMTENDVTLCGHGSGKPSLKNMYGYLQSRWEQKAPNGKRKGLVAVMRLKAMTDEGRKKFKDYYTTILGRNFYSQPLRAYCYRPYKDGLYYSDCSSSGILTYQQCGYKFPWILNTAGIYESDLFEKVSVTIKDGHVVEVDRLRVGDALLFAGNDPDRPLQIGHVEYIYSIPESVPEYPKWIKSGDEWYYRLKPGENAHGWRKIPETGHPENVHWYYFDEKGKMLKDWFKVGEEWYYAQPSGGLEGALYHTDDRGAQSIWYVE